MMSKRTKQCRDLKNLFTFLHILLLVAPFCYFLPYGYVVADTTEKVVLSLGLTITAIILLVALVVDVKHKAGLHKSALWIMICIITMCVKELNSAFIITMTIVSLLDELCIVHVANYYKNALIANKEIDKRGE